MKNVSKKLLDVIGSVSGKVEKSGYNTHQKYKYVMEADLLDAVRAEIVKAGLLITSSVEHVEKEGNLTTVKLLHTITDVESGEKLEVHSAGQGADNQDKGVFKAITGANKYFLLKTFLLSGDDDPENDSVGDKHQATKPAQPKTTTLKPTTTTKPTLSTGSGPKPPTPKPSFKKPVPPMPQKAQEVDKATSSFDFGTDKVNPEDFPNDDIPF